MRQRRVGGARAHAGDVRALASSTRCRMWSSRTSRSPTTAAASSRVEPPAPERGRAPDLLEVRRGREPLAPAAHHAAPAPGGTSLGAARVTNVGQLAAAAANFNGCCRRRRVADPSNSTPGRNRPRAGRRVRAVHGPTPAHAIPAADAPGSDACRLRAGHAGPFRPCPRCPSRGTACTTTTSAGPRPPVARLQRHASSTIGPSSGPQLHCRCCAIRPARPGRPARSRVPTAASTATRRLRRSKPAPWAAPRLVPAASASTASPTRRRRRRDVTLRRIRGASTARAPRRRERHAQLAHGRSPTDATATACSTRRLRAGATAPAAAPRSPQRRGRRRHAAVAPRRRACHARSRPGPARAFGAATSTSAGTRLRQRWATAAAARRPRRLRHEPQLGRGLQPVTAAAPAHESSTSPTDAVARFVRLRESHGRLQSSSPFWLHDPARRLGVIHVHVVVPGGRRAVYAAHRLRRREDRRATARSSSRTCTTCTRRHHHRPPRARHPSCASERARQLFGRPMARAAEGRRPAVLPRARHARRHLRRLARGQRPGTVEVAADEDDGPHAAQLRSGGCCGSRLLPTTHAAMPKLDRRDEPSGGRAARRRDGRDARHAQPRAIAAHGGVGRSGIDDRHRHDRGIRGPPSWRARDYDRGDRFRLDRFARRRAAAPAPRPGDRARHAAARGCDGSFGARAAAVRRDRSRRRRSTHALGAADPARQNSDDLRRSRTAEGRTRRRTSAADRAPRSTSSQAPSSHLAQGAPRAGAPTTRAAGGAMQVAGRKRHELLVPRRRQRRARAEVLQGAHVREDDRHARAPPSRRRRGRRCAAGHRAARRQPPPQAADAQLHPTTRMVEVQPYRRRWGSRGQAGRQAFVARPRARARPRRELTSVDRRRPRASSSRATSGPRPTCASRCGRRARRDARSSRGARCRGARTAAATARLVREPRRRAAASRRPSRTRSRRRLSVGIEAAPAMLPSIRNRSPLDHATALCAARAHRTPPTARRASPASARRRPEGCSPVVAFAQRRLDAAHPDARLRGAARRTDARQQRRPRRCVAAPATRAPPPNAVASSPRPREGPSSPLGRLLLPPPPPTAMRAAARSPQRIPHEGAAMPPSRSIDARPCASQPNVGSPASCASSPPRARNESPPAAAAAVWITWRARGPSLAGGGAPVARISRGSSGGTLPSGYEEMLADDEYDDLLAETKARAREARRPSSG